MRGPPDADDLTKAAEKAAKDAVTVTAATNNGEGSGSSPSTSKLPSADASPSKSAAKKG